jgi:hypothetical protein
LGSVVFLSQFSLGCGLVPTNATESVIFQAALQAAMSTIFIPSRVVIETNPATLY